ncbi:MAG: recombinase family protein [Sphingomonadaceae bacterium]|nr:recombinase family protein [Sphingomonadaceae bacterium]
MRAAIYARYSSDLQSSASIDDQVRLCRKLCDDNGWTVVEVFADEAMSGASHLRPGFQELQNAAMRGQVDIIVAEALDRLSRDQEHIAGLYKRMSYLGVKIVTKSEGEINELHIGLGGTMSALFLKQLAQKTHRGLEGRIKAGKSAGGLSYGYKMERHLLPDGTFTTGERSIDPIQAALIQRIFTDYDRGKSARTIAIALNKEGVAPPRGGSEATWSFSTIAGNWKRGTGILNNELYIGRLVWNRQRFIKDPSTGKRQARPNPPEAWIIEDVPDLRIIADDLWLRVKHRQGAIREDILTVREQSPNAPRAEAGRRARYLFSGLLACGCCGANYVMISDSRYGCSANRNRGTCDNRKTIARADVEGRVLEGLNHKLMAPDLIAEFIAEFQREVQKERLGAITARDEAERRLSKVCKDIDSIITAITEGMFHPSMKTKMDALEAEKANLEAQLRDIPAEDPITLHPGLADIYARKVANLAEALNAEDTKAEAADILRGLIDKLILTPDATAANGHKIELFGELGAILSLGNNGMGTNAKTHALGVGYKQVTVVAGAGFAEAPTIDIAA